jgi:hypothetical protein
MASDLILFLAKANLALAAAVLLVLVLRKPVRAAFGARCAYALWLVAPLSVLALLVPARTVVQPLDVAPTAAVIRAPAAPVASGASFRRDGGGARFPLPAFRSARSCWGSGASWPWAGWRSRPSASGGSFARWAGSAAATACCGPTAPASAPP